MTALLNKESEHNADPRETVQIIQQHEHNYEPPSKTSSVNDSQDEPSEHSADTSDELHTSHDEEEQGSDQEWFHDESSQASNDSDEQHSAAHDYNDDFNEDDAPSLQSNITAESDITIPTTADFQIKM